VALTVTVWPAASGLPFVVATTIRSLDSSEWKTPEVPSAQVPPMVFGWFGSAPPDMLSLPSSSEGPESHEIPAVEHSGALKVEL